MKVVSKQKVSKDCIICGINNEFGLKANFYNMEDGSVGSIFTFKSRHQSYPERVHGGMISALLDELAGRALWVTDPEALAVTSSMSIKFRKPVPYDAELLGRGEIIRRSGRLFVASAKILDKDKNVLAELQGNYVILPPEKIASNHSDKDNYLLAKPDDVTDIDF